MKRVKKEENECKRQREENEKKEEREKKKRENAKRDSNSDDGQKTAESLPVAITTAKQSLDCWARWRRTRRRSPRAPRPAPRSRRRTTSSRARPRARSWPPGTRSRPRGTRRRRRCLGKQNRRHELLFFFLLCPAFCLNCYNFKKKKLKRCCSRRLPLSLSLSFSLFFDRSTRAQ